MTIFQSLVYPDNERRAQRVFDLGNDYLLFYERLASQKAAISQALAALGEACHNIMPRPKDAPEKKIPVTISPEWTEKASPVIAKMLIKLAFKKAMTAAAGAFAVQSGVVSLSTMQHIFRAPGWLLGNNFAQGIGATMLADLVIAAVSGAKERSKLRAMIKEMVEARQSLALYVRQNEVLLEGLRGASTALAVIGKTSNFRNTEPEQRDNIVSDILEQCLLELNERHDSVDEALIRSELEQLDRQRKSFMEDG